MGPAGWPGEAVELSPVPSTRSKSQQSRAGQSRRMSCHRDSHDSHTESHPVESARSEVICSCGGGGTLDGGIGQ